MNEEDSELKDSLNIGTVPIGTSYRKSCIWHDPTVLVRLWKYHIPIMNTKHILLFYNWKACRERATYAIYIYQIWRTGVNINKRFCQINTPYSWLLKDTTNEKRAGSAISPIIVHCCLLYPYVVVESYYDVTVLVIITAHPPESVSSVRTKTSALTFLQTFLDLAIAQKSSYFF